MNSAAAPAPCWPDWLPDLAVTGVDQSPEMLATATRRGLRAELVQADMTAFSLGTRFDVVICVFDTLNHLARFESWREMFDRVREHLAGGGLFVFDVNTVGRLRRLWQGPAFAADFGENTLIMDVLPAGSDETKAAELPAGSGDNGADELSTWTVRIFEHVAGDAFRLHAERIPELGVPLATIREALAANFDVVEEAGLDGRPPTDESGRAFFVYRRRA